MTTINRKPEDVKIIQFQLMKTNMHDQRLLGLGDDGVLYIAVSAGMSRGYWEKYL